MKSLYMLAAAVLLAAMLTTGTTVAEQPPTWGGQSPEPRVESPGTTAVETPQITPEGRAEVDRRMGRRLKRKFARDVFGSLRDEFECSHRELAARYKAGDTEVASALENGTEFWIAVYRCEGLIVGAIDWAVFLPILLEWIMALLVMFL